MIDPLLESEYNNRAKVPEHGAIMQSWKQDAAAFRATHPHCELDLAYGDSARQRLDLFWPDQRREGPIALFIHGGYWQALDRSWFSHLARGFIAHGVALAVPSYDLCPQVSLGTLVEQMRGAVAFLIRRHERAVFSCGHSAGGHLTAMLLATGWAARGLPPAAVFAGCAISGLFDLMPLLATSVNGALGLDVATARGLSPLFLPTPGLPLHAVVGAAEGTEYLRQSRSIAEAWGGTCDLLPGANHFTAIAPLTDPGSPIMATMLRMIAGGLPTASADQRDRYSALP